MSAPLRETVSPGATGVIAGEASCARVLVPLAARPNSMTRASDKKTVNRRIATLLWSCAAAIKAAAKSHHLTDDRAPVTLEVRLPAWRLPARPRAGRPRSG